MRYDLQFKRFDFLRNKLKGDFAEMVCKNHFTCMGYNVDKIGVEELSPSLVAIENMNTNVKAIRNYLHSMPDFLIVDEQRSYAAFVEVKYRKDIKNKQQLKEFSNELHKQYASLISLCQATVYFYLVCSLQPHIYILKAKYIKGKEDTGGFYKAGDSMLDKFKFFMAYKEKYPSFNTVFNDIIKPFIETHI